MKDLTAISQEGENLLLELMNDGVKFRSDGVFTKHVLRQLARRTRGNIQETKKCPPKPYQVHAKQVITKGATALENVNRVLATVRSSTSTEDGEE